MQNRVREPAQQGDTVVLRLRDGLLRFTAKRFKRVAGGQRSVTTGSCCHPFRMSVLPAKSPAVRWSATAGYSLGSLQDESQGGRLLRLHT